MNEDPEITVEEVKATSCCLKIEFQANCIQKIMIMQKKSKDNWQNILEKKIEDEKISEIIQEISNLDPATKYKFQAILTTKDGKIIQLDEVRIITKEHSGIKLSEENINLMKTTCGEKRKLRIVFVGPKSSGKTSIINSIASILSRDHITPISNDKSAENSRATSDVAHPNTTITLVEYNGLFDQSKNDTYDLNSFIHGLIPENALLNDASQSHVAICFDNTEQRKLDAIVIVVPATESKGNLDHIRQYLLLANKAAIKSVVFVTKVDLLTEQTAVTSIVNAMVERNIPKELIYHTMALNIDHDSDADLQAKPLLLAMKYLTQNSIEKQRGLRVLMRQKDKEIFKRCYIEGNKSYINLLELICKTFVLTHPPLNIYELKNGIKIAIDIDNDVKELKEDAMIEFEVNSK